MKQCRACLELKPLEGFPKDSRLSDGRQSNCKACATIFKKRWCKLNPEKVAAQGRRYREAHPHRRWAKGSIDYHRRRGCEVSITWAELEALAKTTPQCAYCGCSLDWGYGAKGSGPRPDSPTVDRRVGGSDINSLDDISIVCASCNRAKGEMPLEEFLKRFRPAA